MRNIITAILGVVLFGSCAAIRDRDTPAAPGVATAGSAGFKNVRLLRVSSRDELIQIMRGFNAALGVKCDFCHVPIAGTDKFDFPSDANPHKNIARTMIQMTASINQQYIRPLSDDATVTCMTCHRGAEEPDDAPAGAESGT